VEIFQCKIMYWNQKEKYTIIRDRSRFVMSAYFSRKTKRSLESIVHHSRIASRPCRPLSENLEQDSEHSLVPMDQHSAGGLFILPQLISQVQPPRGKSGGREYYEDGAMAVLCAKHPPHNHY